MRKSVGEEHIERSGGGLKEGRKRIFENSEDENSLCSLEHLRQEVQHFGNES